MPILGWLVNPFHCRSRYNFRAEKSTSLWTMPLPPMTSLAVLYEVVIGRQLCSVQRLKHYVAEYTSYMCICDFSSALIPTILVVIGPFWSVRKRFGARELRNRYPTPHLLRQSPRRVQEEGGGAVVLIAGWIVLHPICSSTVAFRTL